MRFSIAALALLPLALATPTAILDKRQTAPDGRPAPSQVAKGGSDILSGLANGFKGTGTTEGSGVGSLLSGLSGGLGSLSSGLQGVPPPPKPPAN